MRIFRLERAVFESRKRGVCISFPVIIDKSIRLIIHSLAQIGELREDGRTASPGQQRGIQADDFPVKRILKLMRYGYRIVVDEFGLLEPIGELIEIFFEGDILHSYKP